MAKKADNNTNSDASKNIIDAMLKGYADYHYNHITPKRVAISSGSLKIDSYARAYSGTIIRMGGPAEAGKTSQTLLFLSQYMLTLPKSKCIYIDAEFKLSDELKNRSGLTFVYSGEDWEYGTVLVLKTNFAEPIADFLQSALKTAYEQGEHIGIALDSVDMLQSVKEVDKQVGAPRTPAGINKLTKELFRRICPMINAYDALLIMITQFSSVFYPDQYAKKDPQMMDGNNTHALNHQCSLALYYRNKNKSDFILEDEKSMPDPVTNKILGTMAKVEIKKSATDSTGYMIEVPIKKGRVGNCVWVEKEAGDMILAYELAKKSGAWITFDNDIVKEAKAAGVDVKEKINGINALYDYLETDKAAREFLIGKVKFITNIRMSALGDK